MFLRLMLFSKLLDNWLKFSCFCEKTDYLRMLFSEAWPWEEKTRQLS